MYIRETKKSNISLFVYAHILDAFAEHILPHLPKQCTYTIYIHNSDFGLEEKHKSMVDNECITHVYAQNINITHPKASFLPIGIANAQWDHGNLDTLYACMISGYYKKKTKGVYVNVNVNTYPYRKTVLDKLRAAKFPILSTPLPYKEYLNNLQEHMFCICVRGNGIDTHRFYECLYLNVIPIIIQNEHTNMQAFVKHLRGHDFPFIEIADLEFFDTHGIDYFNEELYQHMCSTRRPVCTEALKLSYYKNDSIVY